MAKPGPKKQFDARLRLRLSEAVMEKLRRKAESMGISLSDFLRLALGEIEEVPTNEEKDDAQRTT